MFKIIQTLEKYSGYFKAKNVLINILQIFSFVYVNLLSGIAFVFLF